MLISRNIIVGELRTSMRLEPEFWSALNDIAERENVSIDQLFTVIDTDLRNLGRTAATRVFVASYFSAERAIKHGTQDEQPQVSEAAYQALSQTPRYALD
jgi:predicted DNA-binding ribbon-helix-helix protein